MLVGSAEEKGEEGRGYVEGGVGGGGGVWCLWEMQGKRRKKVEDT